ncbi:MAG: molybdopterin-dependent oxidoreductase [Deltaproteobacteria bacterium]
MDGSPIPTICKICDEHCGILVADDGKKVTITGNRAHPVSRGFVCVKGKNFGEVHHSPHRLTSPLLRKKSGWEEISFEAALDVLASNFQRCKREFGPESVDFFKGEGLKHFEVAQYMRHLTNGFGSPNYVSIGSLCHYAQVMGHALTYGGKPIPDFERIGVAILWGANPAASSPRMFGELRTAVRQGIKLIVVDPVSSRTAKLAHVHLPVRPGSDGFLALAFLKQAIEEKKLAPKDDLEQGWHDLVELVGDLSYRDLLQRADIKDRAFHDACDLLFDHLPAWTRVGLGLEHRPGGVQTIRTASCLQSILDPENRPFHMAAHLKALPGADQYPEMPLPIGEERTPLFTKGRREGQGMFLTRAILNAEPYAVHAMLVAGANPMLTFPGVPRQREALQHLDFLAVFDLFMTPTARLADLVIPGADHLDNLELHDYGRIGSPYLGLMRPATSSPKGWPTWRLVFELARSLGLGDLFPWEDNRQALAYRLSGTSVTLNDLEGSESSTAMYQADKPSNERWHTKDGKVHYRSNELYATGNHALPVPEAIDLPEQTDGEYPFWLSTGDRVLAYQHGQFREIPVYEKMVPEPLVDIHPNAAARLGIQSGELVVLSTRYGHITIRAHVTQEVREDCLRMTHGWEQANANELTGLEHFDAVSGYPWLKAVPGKVERQAGH